MVRKYTSIAHDAGARKRDVVMAAGEFLEAAHMARGKHTGEHATVIEGLPKGHKAKMADPLAPSELVIATR